MTSTPAFDLSGDVVALTRALCDIPSVSGQEKEIADAVEIALRACPHLEVLRDGDAVVARTALGRPSRVVLAGHLDTVPVAGNLPTTTTGEGDAEMIHGRGTVDMKAGVAVFLHLAATLSEPRHDVTYVFYDHEEVASRLNGLGRLVRTHPDWLAGDFAVLGEPSNAAVEGGCQGTMRVRITVPGMAAHPARSWMGSNAIHSAGAVLDVLRAYQPRRPVVDGLHYREGLNAVKIEGGIAGNVIPDECAVFVNYRFAPDRSVEEAEAHLRELFGSHQVEVTDAAPGARPGLDHPAARAFVEAVGGTPTAKLGWTDVSRFAALGVPAVNYGPGDPLLAHKGDEQCPAPAIRDALRGLQAWLA
ncbi:succinyl-diaminopimelate desuccinylase [Mangrovihabitans endophyticus]|uniref:Succinyl-diaminopimelate desuccinylase n=1 Tax=Mangrovihabitans endophyticus TaxID=1751298 RepID=A0A8J3FQF0_9ACTN|nr:succinyl-diaminopimelate desuccinylase [Mangrovihabitans endophyticus]GGL09036.1 succinyl-diaminopimelate desuccinylase [Mangrovihabitans endophyticus]